MEVKEALYKELIATTAVTALLGTRIYPNRVPLKANLPYAAITVILTGRFEHSSGSDSGSPEGPYIQISIYGKTPDSAYEASAAVKTAIMDFSGTMGGSGGLSVSRALFEDSGDLYDDKNRWAGIYLDFIVWHN